MDYKTIGRANPIGDIQKWQANESDLLTAQKNRAVQDLNMERTSQVIQEDQRKFDAQIKEQKKLDEEIPWEVATSGFQTGEGSPGELLTKTAIDYGFLDMSLGGQGTISPRRKAALMKIMAQPEMIKKRTRTAINFGRANYNKLKEELMKKPNDPKLQQAFQEAEVSYRQAIGEAKEFEGLLKKQEDSRTPAIKEYEYGVENPEFAAAQREPQEGLTVSLYNPETKREIKVRRGSDYYEQFLESGYEEGTAKEEQPQEGLKVSLYNPQIKKRIDVRRGSDFYKQKLAEGYEEGIVEDGAGEKETVSLPEEQVGGEPFITIEEAEKGVGPLAVAKQLINNTIGAIVPGQPFPDTEEARNKIYALNQKLRPFLKVSRMGAKFDIKNIDKMLPNPKTVLQDPDAMKTKFNTLYNLIDSSLVEKKRLWNGANEKQRQTLADDIMKLQEVISILPKPTSEEPDVYSNMTKEEIFALDRNVLSEQDKQAIKKRVIQLLKEKEKR